MPKQHFYWLVCLSCFMAYQPIWLFNVKIQHLLVNDSLDINWHFCSKTACGRVKIILKTVFLHKVRIVENSIRVKATHQDIVSQVLWNSCYHLLISSRYFLVISSYFLSLTTTLSEIIMKFSIFYLFNYWFCFSKFLNWQGKEIPSRNLINKQQFTIYKQLVFL